MQMLQRCTDSDLRYSWGLQMVRLSWFHLFLPLALGDRYCGFPPCLSSMFVTKTHTETLTLNLSLTSTLTQQVKGGTQMQTRKETELSFKQKASHLFGWQNMNTKTKQEWTGQILTWNPNWEITKQLWKLWRETLIWNWTGTCDYGTMK